ncbi:MAG: hypothetical protein JSS95_07285 [Acidobacteria bacterium]|nr:hypothetical protein [Acidobacteriota bacterium]
MMVRVLALLGMTAVGMAQSSSQHVSQNAVLTVSGRTGQAPVITRNGRSYVDVEALARVSGATLGFNDNRIVLTLPAPAPAAPVVPRQPAPLPKEDKGYSREFLRAGVEQLTVAREWRSALENAIRTNNPVEESWVSYYRRTAQDKMAMATASATTDADRQALPLLQSDMAMVGQLSDRFLALRTTLTYVPPDSLDNDPLDKKILACAQGMASQAIPGGAFEDVSACH